MRSSASRCLRMIPVYKVSIIPRGRALGVTMFLPEEDRYSHSKEHLESQISSLFGGRIAEELIFGPESVTTGASNDILRATDIARNMVTKWGLSDRMGPLSYGEDEGEVFLGRSVTQHKALSDDTAHAIDEEVRAFIDRNYERAANILNEYIDKLHAMADALMKFETIDSDQINDIMAGRDPRPPAGWDDDSARERRGRSPGDEGEDASGDGADRRAGRAALSRVISRSTPGLLVEVTLRDRAWRELSPVLFV